MRQHDYYVYIMASESGTLYIDVTNNLERRVSEHKLGLTEGFTKKYNCKKLVYYEYFSEVEDAIHREKVLKGWLRKRKKELIETANPAWKDLTKEWD